MHVYVENSIRGGWFAHSFQPPALAGVFLAKLSCRLHPNAAATLLVDDELVELNGDKPQGDAPANPLKFSSDFAPYKPRFDLLLNATSCSPSRAPELSWNARWRVGEWSKSLRIFGDRAWLVEPLGFRIGPTTALAQVPLDYRLAYGGPTSKLNPVGRGYGPQAVQLPNIEDPARPIANPGDNTPPAGVGPIAPAWAARQRYVGTYGEHWQRTRWPWFPEDFDYAFFNAAPPDQQLERGLIGDEELSFENLHPDHPQFRTRLPGIRVRCFVSESRLDPRELTMADFREVPLLFDTLQIDMHEQVATLLFRGATPIQSLKMVELQTVFMMAEPVAAPPLSASEWETRFKALVQADDDEPEDPEELAADEAERREFDARMEALEVDYAQVMKEAEQHEAAARTRAIDAGMDASKFDQPGPSTLAEMKAQLLEIAEALRITQPERVAELESHIAELEELERVEKEMQAEDSGVVMSREEVERRAAAGESFHGLSLADLELYDLQLSGLDFSDADFSECMLDGADLSGCNLTNANFSEADLSQANLSGACLDYANFFDAVLEGCNFSNTSLENVNLSGLDLTGLNFRGARGRGADFSQAKLHNADFSHAHLPQADFSEAELSGACFDHAHLSAANLEGVAAAGIRMRHADLTGLHASDQADFSRSDLRQCAAEGSIWEESNLDGCDFSESNLRTAIFTNASLATSRLDRCDLSDTVFDDANLTGASLDQCNLIRASLDRANLSSARMRQANIYLAGFWNAKLDGLDRRGTSLIGTVITDE